MDGIWDALLHADRLLISLLFIFSGFVKAVDPLGTVYKIQDYLTAFGGVFGSLTVVAYPVAFLLILLELMIGLDLLFQVHVRISSLLAFLFMLVMTPLTLYIALYNPVTDCGCFGDALKITNWQTFFKNVIFLVLTLSLFLFSKKFKQFYLVHVEWIFFFLLLAGGLAFMLHNLYHLPMLDFRPYKVGVNIPDAMKIPDDAPSDVYESSFVYEKNGVRESFTYENLPDSTWTFVDQKTKLISRGFIPPIHDFSVMNAVFEDITDRILSSPGNTYLFILYDLDQASEKGIAEMIGFYNKAKDKPVRFYVLTASNSSVIHEFKEKYKLNIPFYKTDPITLKTMIRSNPGLILIEKGTVKGKWHWRDFQ